MNPEDTKKQKPSYISIQKLEKTIELASNRNFAQVNSAMFTQYGFGPSDAILAVSTLRFLGVVDETGKATPLMAKLRLQGEARKQVFHDLVKNSYKKLFNVSSEAHKLSDEELGNEMIIQYNLSPRVARTAVPVFKKLCEYAGLIEAGTIVAGSPKPRDKSKTSESKPAKKKESAPGSTKDNPWNANTDYFIQQVVKDKVTIAIPEEWHLNATLDDDMNAAWRKALKEVKTFADAYAEKYPETPKEENDADTGG